MKKVRWNRLSVSFYALLAIHLGCVSGIEEHWASDAGEVGTSYCLKCDGEEVRAELDLRIPSHMAVARILARSLRTEGVIDETAGWEVSQFLKGTDGPDKSLQTFVQDILEAGSPLAEGARQILFDALSGKPSLGIPLLNDTYAVETGDQPYLFDDTLYVFGDGFLQGDTDLISHSRGYAAKTDGVLFKAHGSFPPEYPLSTAPDVHFTLQSQGPARALDQAARTAKLPLDAWSTFLQTAYDPNYYDPGENTPYWAGICQGWTHNALDNRLSLLVDVPGTEGRKGRWIFGQWLSRADLGNAMMGASYSLGIADSVTLDSFVTPLTLVLGLAQYVLGADTGLRVDIWNDEHNPSGVYNPQIWNQPLVRASLDFRSIPEASQEAIRTWWNTQKGSGYGNGRTVKWIQARGEWGTEAHDAWEGEALFKSSTWNLYALIDDSGKVVDGVMANVLSAAGVSPLPVTESDGLPDYIALPLHRLTDAAFAGTANPLLDSGHGDGLRFRFLVGTVLAYGVSDDDRRAFEHAVFEMGTPRADLIPQFPGIANAYSPEQWDTFLRAHVGHPADFGALWASADPLF